jgi:Fe-S oxidoreductase
MPFDLNAPAFYDPQEMTKELERVYDICNGCRRCFHLCPSFDHLFERLDAHDGEATHLTAPEHRRVVDLCYECQLCYNHCPYTPPHRFDIDFPHLMLRAKLAQAKEQGVKWQDRLLGDTDRLGKLAAPAAPLVNFANGNRVNRLLLGFALGVHPDRNLPTFQRQTFRQWAKQWQKGQRGTSTAPAGKAALFYTCFVNYNGPEIGRAAVNVLEKNNVQVAIPEQQCCGMPFLDAKDLPACQKKARFNLQRLAEAVNDGYEVVVPGPTCSLMLKHEYPMLAGSEEARLVSQHTFDISEYLMRLHGQGKLDTGFKASQGRIAYHLPCHLKAQNIGYKSRDLMGLIPGTQVTLLEHCSGHDGTWSMKKEYFELSLQVGKKLFDGIRSAEPDLVATDCPLAALQIEKGTGKKPLHPIQVVQRAYGS